MKITQEELRSIISEVIYKKKKSKPKQDLSSKVAELFVKCVVELDENNDFPIVPDLSEGGLSEVAVSELKKLMSPKEVKKIVLAISNSSAFQRLIKDSIGWVIEGIEDEENDE